MNGGGLNALKRGIPDEDTIQYPDNIGYLRWQEIRATSGGGPR